MPDASQIYGYRTEPSIIAARLRMHKLADGSISISVRGDPLPIPNSEHKTANSEHAISLPSILVADLIDCLIPHAKLVHEQHIIPLVLYFSTESGRIEALELIKANAKPGTMIEPNCE